MTRRATKVCVDCGTPKSPAQHYMTQRCRPCQDGYTAAAREANRLVHAAMRRGEVLPAAGRGCVDCGGTATDLEHRDYTKPLQVEPTCRSCNFARGPALWRVAQEA